jgi:hypothetical protein
MADVPLASDVISLGMPVGVTGQLFASVCEWLQSEAAMASVAWARGSNGSQATISIATAARNQRTGAAYHADVHLQAFSRLPASRRCPGADQNRPLCLLEQTV